MMVFRLSIDMRLRDRRLGLSLVLTFQNLLRRVYVSTLIRIDEISHSLDLRVILVPVCEVI